MSEYGIPPFEPLEPEPEPEELSGEARILADTMRALLGQP